jgi:hypothetical protein
MKRHQRGPVQDESGVLDPVDARGMAVIEGRILPKHRRECVEYCGASCDCELKYTSGQLAA